MPTAEERFLEKLQELSGGPGKAITNITLRKTLKWGDKIYANASQRLKAKKLIKGVVGGPGGSVELLKKIDNKPVLVFISYSHVDEDLKNQLLAHLGPLKRLGIITDWHDRKIKPGEFWGQEISKNLEMSDVVILLISADFINSEYCYEKEFSAAMELQEQEKIVVVPVIGRSCVWKELPFGQQQALPKDGKAIESWANRDDALADVAHGISIIAKDLRKNAPHT